MKYRIIRVEEFNDIYYIIQCKLLFIWTDLKDGFTEVAKKFKTLGEAEDAISNLKFKTKRTIIKEYD